MGVHEAGEVGRGYVGVLQGRPGGFRNDLQ